MIRPFTKRYLSGGVPVSPAVHALIRQGDQLRLQPDWPGAAEAYRRALESDGSLAHIWIQLGHALKESKDNDGAAKAYRMAARLRPDTPEPHLLLGHIAKNAGQTKSAIGHFLRAMHAGNSDTALAHEARLLFGRYWNEERQVLRDMLHRELAKLPPHRDEAPLLKQLRETIDHDPEPDEGDGDGRTIVVFDLSDLISYFRNARLPTGIQRVQIETIEGALRDTAARDVRLCCFIDNRDDWLEIPIDQMRNLAQLSVSGGDRYDPEWLEALDRLRLHLSLTRPFIFPRGAYLINLGTSWWLQNYFLFVRHAKATRGIRYVPFVHDMIPIMAPEHCVRELTQDFITWAIGVFDHADHYLVNSEATKRDLLRVAGILEHAVDPADIAVIPLNADFAKPGLTRLPATELQRWGLEPQRFVLFVSTIESRKGHMVAFNAWAELVGRHGAAAVPKLVCVGNRGWLNDRIYARLEEDDQLGEHVVMLSHLTDEQLSLLYRSCLFTLYPSLYEGWGLPVTESLCHGKVPLLSDAASLPEAGGDFAVYAAAGSVEALTAAAERLILEPDHRTALERRIVDGFQPRPWAALARQIGSEIAEFARRDGRQISTARPPKRARIGSWHPIRRNHRTRIWPGMQLGEAFRSDLGWLWPENHGCRLKHEGGELTIGIDGPHPVLRIFILVAGGHGENYAWAVAADSGARVHGEGEAGLDSWIMLDLPAADHDHDVRLSLTVPGTDKKRPTYMVQGFFLCAADDAKTRSAFLEAVILQRLDLLDAHREPDDQPTP